MEKKYISKEEISQSSFMIRLLLQEGISKWDIPFACINTMKPLIF